MIKHYLKVAFRNLWKYKYQTLVSVIGLAVGFACFAMATLWIRYEMTYDSFHKNAGRLYCVVSPDGFSPHLVSREGSCLMAGYLKSTFPEIANATPLLPENENFESEGISLKADFLGTDSSFFSIFDVKVIDGNMDFLIPENKIIAITTEKARQLFGDESPLGKTIKRRGNDYTIGAIVTGLPKRSNYPFDFLYTLQKPDWMVISSGENILVELVEGVDVEAFKKKLYKHTVKLEENRREITQLSLIPLTSVRYEDPNIKKEVAFQHIIIFAVAGSLLILCTLFNYLTLFISRFRLRQRELALRIVCGASNRSLFALLSVEFAVSLIIALLFGLLLILSVIQPFMKLSEIRLDLSAIYLELLVYIAGIILVSLLTFIVVIAVFRRRSLNANIHRNNKKLFRKTSIVFQLIISIIFAFCTIIILKQMYHLHNTDLGFAIKNRGSLFVRHFQSDRKTLKNKIQQIPEITETVESHSTLLPFSLRISQRVEDWDDKPENAMPVNIEIVYVSEQTLSYYDIKIAEGEMLKNHDKDVMINESAAKAFGWHTSVGKMFSGENRVKGVVKNIHNVAPTISPRPTFYEYSENYFFTILFKYTENTWKSCKTKIEEIFRKEYPEERNYKLYNSEEEYDKFLKSENTLLKILTLVSIMCVFVCVFGFVSMVSLTCEERRKEIAIRKINGATIKDILDIFFKEHLTLLAAGALVAFPAGYLIMRRWLEEYVVQTEISVWVYIVILLALFMAIVLCVGGRVYKTSRENPVNSIKN
jgi:cell division protein FtsX